MCGCMCTLEIRCMRLYNCLCVFADNRYRSLLAKLFSTLRSTNCGFKSIHSYNIGRVCDEEKDWEGHRGIPPVKAQFIGLASLAEDKRMKQQTVQWISDPRIKPKHLYSISLIKSHSKPGREGYKCDWNFKYTCVFNPPIHLPKGVGRGVHYPFDSHSAHLRHPFQLAQRRIHEGIGCILFIHVK
jgi:hypothetical protein